MFGEGSRWQRAALVLDWLALTLGGLCVLIQISGGVRFLAAGTIISARDPWRPALAALVALLISRLIAPGRRFLDSSPADWRRRFSRLYVTGADDVRWVPWQGMAAACAGVCVVGTVLLWPQLREMGSVPDMGDPLLSMWRIGWVFQQLRGDPRGLFDANIFYPEPLTFTYSDSMLLPALTAAPLLAAGVHPVVAYNVVMISGLVLSGLAAALLVTRLTGSARAGLIAGVVFGFYPYHFEHYSHLELQMMQWMPMALLAVHRFLATRQMRYAVAAALASAAQLYSSMYYGVFFSIYATVVIGTLMVCLRPPLRRLLMPGAVAAVVVVVLAVPLVQPYKAATQAKGDRGKQEVAIFSATPSDYLRAHFRSAVYGTRMLPNRYPERALFPGLVPIALAVVGLVPPLGAVRLAYVAGLLVAFDGSLGLNGYTYPYLYDFFSPVRGLRVPARFSVLVALSLCVLTGFGVARLLALSRRAASRHATFAVIAAAAVINVWPILTFERVWPEPPPVYGALAGARDVVLTEFPFPVDYGGNTLYMYFSLWHWAPMTNGYSGFMPRSYEPFRESIGDFPGPRSLAALKARGVTHVTVNCAFYRGPCDGLLEQLDGIPVLRRIADGRWQGKQVQLFELKR